MRETAENLSRRDATPVCILAGGLSSRLRPLTDALPKCMVTVGDKPFLLWLLEHLGSLGFRRFILAVGYRREAIRDFFGAGEGFGWRIDYSADPAPLGTGGAVLWAQPLWGRRALVLNGDTYLPADWAAMLDAHDRAGLPATMALVAHQRADSPRRGRFGSVRVDGGRVVGFSEKPAPSGPPARQGGLPRRGWINGGAYVLDDAALAGRRRGETFSLERDLFPSLAGRIGAFCCDDVPFADIGTPESLASFRRMVQGGPEKPSADRPRRPPGRRPGRHGSTEH